MPMDPRENSGEPARSGGSGPPEGKESRGDNGNDTDSKLDAQISLIREALGDEVGIALKPDGELDYLYRKHVILVRDAYLERVLTILFGRRDSSRGEGEPGFEPPPEDGEGGEAGERGKGEPEDGPGFVAGVILVSIRGSRYPDVPAALDVIDRELGEGVATPDHILSVTPAICCPATEPDVVPATTLPDPGICDGGGSGVLVYVPDTGFIAAAAAEHPWLAGVSGAADPFGEGEIKEYGGHGTFIAGVARCMAPGAAVTVTSDFRRGGVISERRLVRRLNEGLGTGAGIISLSAGGATRKDLPLLGFEAWLRRYRYHKNLVLVAAAGNNARSRPFWPAAFSQVVSVGALSADGRSRAYFSDFGSWVDVYAPGENLVNAYGTGRYKYREPPRRGQERRFHGMARWSGTSFSTPLVAGLIAARMSRTGETARLAADALLAHARAERIPGVGPVLLPCDTGDSAAQGCGCGCCGCRR